MLLVNTAFLAVARRGMISIGFFATKDGMAAAYPPTPLVSWGIFCAPSLSPWIPLRAVIQALSKPRQTSSGSVLCLLRAHVASSFDCLCTPGIANHHSAQHILHSPPVTLPSSIWRLFHALHLPSAYLAHAPSSMWTEKVLACAPALRADGGNGVQLGVQVLGAAAIGGTTLALNTVGFGLLRWLGCLRVPKQVRLPAQLASQILFLPFT